ncbi:MAG: spermine synthase [Tolypothrix sp. Co-bin9]|nr:spermine synthase [Tolypothrix sp. Co-bin9]
MPNSLFIEHHADGLAFYINGDLQFDTADEALYHEYLVIPAISLAVGRFPQTNLQVLICGGGDGLAAREVLRFGQVNSIDLVDYDPEVLELAQTVFKPFNQGSLESARLTVYIQEAFEFVSKIPDNFYHIIICDFTYPTQPEDTSIYSREWFQQLSRVLIPSGIISTNGVSPENSTTGFWCLYQTLLSASLNTKPLQLSIPSFRHHGYGDWGFFLASPVPITRSELESIELPENLQTLTYQKLIGAFAFQGKIATIRHNVTIHSLNYPQLYYYLLNPIDNLEETDIIDKEVNFIDIYETSKGLIGQPDFLKLESIAQIWMKTIDQDKTALDNHPDIDKLLPVQHRYHSPKMTREWIGYLRHLLSEIDLSRLLNSLLERGQELPPQMASELKQLADNLRTGKSMPNLPPKTAEFVMMLSVTLLMANLVVPDAVFGKGSYSSGSTSYSSVDSGSSVYFNLETKFWGLIFTSIGGIWLYNIFTRSNDE